MKKLLIVGLLILISFCGSSYAIEKPINVPISGTSFLPVSLNSGQTCTAYAFHSRDGADFLISDTADGAKYFTVRDGEGIAPEEVYGVPGAILFYAKPVSGTVVIEVLVLKQ
ncbi:MAG TPA: hypothetical protein VGD14_09480 [bacterium]